MKEDHLMPDDLLYYGDNLEVLQVKRSRRVLRVVGLIWRGHES